MSDQPAPEVLAVTDTYTGLVAACVARRHELGLSQIDLEEIAGLTGGYVAKLEIGMKRMGAMSLPVLLQALGLQLAVVRTVPHHERQAALRQRHDLAA